MTRPISHGILPLRGVYPEQSEWAQGQNDINTMVTAKLKYLRISPRKVRLVANLIKGMDVVEARSQLTFLPKRAASMILKLLNSALANAEHNFNLSKENLYISKIIVDPGPSLKRWLPRAMGRATSILKRTSHITLILDERVKTIKKKEKRPIKKVKKIKEEPKAKVPKKTLREVKKVEKPIPKPGLRGLAKRVFRRKSI